MSQENMETVLRCCDAFDRGDYEGAQVTRIHFYATEEQALDAAGARE